MWRYFYPSEKERRKLEDLIRGAHMGKNGFLETRTMTIGYLHPRLTQGSPSAGFILGKGPARYTRPLICCRNIGAFRLSAITGRMIMARFGRKFLSGPKMALRKAG